MVLRTSLAYRPVTQQYQQEKSATQCAALGSCQQQLGPRQDQRQLWTAAPSSLLCWRGTYSSQLWKSKTAALLLALIPLPVR